MLECGALACDPGSPSDCLVAEVYDDGTALFIAPNAERRCTPYSIAAHSLYEESQQESFAGMYDGALMNEGVRSFVENCDQVLTVGTLMTDFNSGAFTSRLDPAKTITVGHHHVHVGGNNYPNVEMGDLLTALGKQLPRRRWKNITATSLGTPSGSGSDAIGVNALYPRWAAILQPATFWLPKQAPLRWASASRACRRARRFTTRHYGVRSAGPRPQPSAPLPRRRIVA